MDGGLVVLVAHHVHINGRILQGEVVVPAMLVHYRVPRTESGDLVVAKDVLETGPEAGMHVCVRIHDSSPLQDREHWRSSTGPAEAPCWPRGGRWSLLGLFFTLQGFQEAK